MRRVAEWLLAGLLAFAVAACASVPGSRQFSSGPPGQRDATSNAGRAHERVLAAYGGAYDNARLQAEVESVVKRLAAASEPAAVDYKVTILNSPSVNAFALPDGQLYLTRGLMGLANDEAELASVLAHEIAHVVARHAAGREEQLRRTELIRNVNDILGDPEIGALALARSKLALASFSRGQELEADEAGIALAAHAGYDAFGAARLLTAMGHNAELRAASRGSPGPVEFLSSHPATPERIGSAEINARRYGSPPSGETAKAAYLASVDGLIYGDDPLDGIARGRRFVHPRLGFAFAAPEGFVLDNTRQAVLGIRDRTGQAMRLDIVHIAPEQSLIEYLNSGWIENVDRGSVEELSINGMPAGAATAKAEQWVFRLYVIRFGGDGGDVFRFIFAAKRYTPQADRAYRETVASLHRPSVAEIQAVKPLRLALVRVAQGDSVESLVSRMATVEQPRDRFRVLNGLDANERPKPGDLVKIIVE